MMRFGGRTLRRFDVEVVDSTLVPLGRGLLIERHLRVTSADARYPVVLDIVVEDGSLECTSISRIDGRVRLDDGRLEERGPRLTGELLRRLPLRRAIQEVVWAQAKESRPTEESEFARLQQRLGPFASDLTGVSYVIEPIRVQKSGIERAERAAIDAMREPRRGSRITDDQLRAIAAVYREALAAGAHPTQAVADGFHVARSTAGRWVMAARGRGFLGPTRERAKGEAPQRKEE